MMTSSRFVDQKHSASTFLQQRTVIFATNDPPYAFYVGTICACPPASAEYQTSLLAFRHIDTEFVPTNHDLRTMRASCFEWRRRKWVTAVS